MGVSIVVTSGKGGTGKTTATSAIASCLAALDNRVLCIDLDIHLRNLDLALGMSDLVTLDLGDVAAERCTLEEAVTAHPQIPGLHLLAAPALAEELSSERMVGIIQEAKDTFDYCLIDSPAGLGSGFRLAAACADRAIIMATSDATSLRDAQRAVMELDEMGMTDLYLIVNRMKPSLLRRISSTIDDMMDFVGIPLLGIVPEDEAVLLAAGSGQPLVLHSKRRASKAFLRIAGRISGETIPLKYT